MRAGLVGGGARKKTHTKGRALRALVLCSRPLVGRHQHCVIDRLHHAVRIGDAAPGDIESRAMIDRGADHGQPQRDIDARERGERARYRVDLKADRKARLLRVEAAHEEAGAPPETAEALAAEVRRLAGWLGLEGIVVAERGDLAAALRGALTAGGN